MRANIHLSEDNTEQIYEETPIENYGEKIFMKMLNNEKDSTFLKKKKAAPKLVEFAPRNHRSGLGFNLENSGLMGNKNDDDKLQSFYGNTIYIKEGIFKGLSAKICDFKKATSFENLIKYNTKLKVQIDINEQIVNIDTKYISINKPLEEDEEDIKEEDNKKIPSTNINNQKCYNLQEDDEEESEEEENNEEEENKKEIEWICPNLIIRIINKESKFYNTKAKVIDLMDKYSFNLLMNDKSIINTFTEDDCETVIPKVGNNVLIVGGENKGEYGKLIDRDKKNNLATLQILDSNNTIIKISQDDICMYE